MELGLESLNIVTTALVTSSLVLDHNYNDKLPFDYHKQP